MVFRGVGVAVLWAMVAASLGGCKWSACVGDCDDLTERGCTNPVTYTVVESQSPTSIAPSGTDYSIRVVASGALILISGDGVACEINIPGHNNLLRFETGGHTVRACRVTGNDNTIERPRGMSLTCDDAGVGNTLLTY